MTDPVQFIVQELAAFGIVTSFVYGPVKNSDILWSVTCMNAMGEQFDRPFAANSLRQAAEIARLECEKRGWA